MATIIGWIVVALTMLLVVVSVAGARSLTPITETPCGPYSRIIAVLGAQFGEAVKATGVIDAQHIMQTLVSKNGSWTVLIIRVDGWTCIRSAGKDWQDTPWKPGTKS